MSQQICPEIMREYVERIDAFYFEECGPTPLDPQDFKNSDEVLSRSVPMAIDNRREFGLDRLVKGLNAVIINTEGINFNSAVKELLDFTGLNLHSSYENECKKEAVLKVDDSADFIVRYRRSGKNPFLPYNIAPKTKDLLNSRLETLVFETLDIEKYFGIQKERGVRFLTEDIVHTDEYSFIQTIPSSFTGNSIGFIEWKGKKGTYISNDDVEIDLGLEKSTSDYLKNVKYLDHAATRLESQNRDAAIIEFMELTNYKFDFAIYVKNFNSITNVARLSDKDYAQVFTTGISPFTSLEECGPTEKYVHNYGPRVHHVAFHTENIEDTYEGLIQDGMEFLSGACGIFRGRLKANLHQGKQEYLPCKRIHTPLRRL